MILIAALAALMFLGGWLSPFEGTWFESWFAWVPGIIWLMAKTSLFLFCFLWFRATFPRYRYDQIMRLGWKVFIPITIVWIVVAGGLVEGEEDLAVLAGDIGVGRDGVLLHDGLEHADVPDIVDEKTTVSGVVGVKGQTHEAALVLARIRPHRRADVEERRCEHRSALANANGAALLDDEHTLGVAGRRGDHHRIVESGLVECSGELAVDGGSAGEYRGHRENDRARCHVH